MYIFRNWIKVFREAKTAEYKLAVEAAHRLFDDGEYQEAAKAYDSLLRRPAEVAKNTVNRGYCELMLGDLDQANASFAQATKSDPSLANAWMGLGDIAAKRGQHEQAVELYTQAIQREPNFAAAHNNRGQSLTALGRLREAWADAEYRFSVPSGLLIYPHTLNLPQWDGKAQGRVLVHWEQGFGDILQHLRFLAVAVRRGHDICFECPPQLLSLVRRMHNSPSLIAATECAPLTEGMDFKAGLLSLPHLLGCDENDLDSSPYLYADAEKTLNFLGSRIAPHLPRIGIVWRASAFDNSRSAPLEWLLNCADRLPRPVQLVSLQRDIDNSEATLLNQHGCIDAGSKFVDFDDTAAAIAAMDATITVDTSVAHLAGALGGLTYLFLNEPSAVRWMVDRIDTPWYQNVRLLRKRSSEHWQPLFAQALQMAINARETN